MSAPLKPHQKNPPKIALHHVYLAYSYDCLAMLTSLIAVSFVLYSIYLAKVLNAHTQQSTLVTLILVNLACIIASFLFKNKIQKRTN